MIIPTLNELNTGGCKILVLIPTEMLSSFPPPDGIGRIDINYISFNSAYTMEDAATIHFKTGDLKMAINPVFIKGDDMCETLITGIIPKDKPDYLHKLELLKSKPCVALVHTNNDYQDGTTVIIVVGNVQEGAKYQPTLRTPGDDAASLNSYTFEVKLTRKNPPSFAFFS
jgi:hypothetical protein